MKYILIHKLHRNISDDKIYFLRKSDVFKTATGFHQVNKAFKPTIYHNKTPLNSINKRLPTTARLFLPKFGQYP